MLKELARYAYRMMQPRLTYRGSLSTALFAAKFQAINHEAFQATIEATPLPSRAIFIDLGCGDGAALELAHAYPFAKFIGVEYTQELAISAHDRCPDADIYCMDAATFDFPIAPLVVFLYNPFTGPIMQAVVDRLAASLASHPRQCVVLYRNPLDAHRWDRSFQRIVTTPKYIAYHRALSNDTK